MDTIQTIVDEAMKLDETLISVDAEGNTTLKLTCPVICDGQPVSELKFRRVTAGDLKAVDTAKTEQVKAQMMLSRVTGMSVPAIDMMDAYDFNQANRVIGNFLLKRRPTGG